MFKLAGVKNEKDFYLKFPTEEAFMAKHGKAFKAQFGMGGGGGSTGDILQGIGGMSGMMGDAGMDAGGAVGAMGGYAGMLNTVGDIGKGLKAIKAGKEAMHESQQSAKVSDIALKASMTPDVDDQRQRSAMMQQRYNAQMRPVNGEELFPINGVGTNVLAKCGASVRKSKKAQHGIDFQPQGSGPYSNVTTPDTIGSSGTGFGDFMQGYGGYQIGAAAGKVMGEDGGSQLGGTLGKTAGNLIGGPIGGMIGNIAGKAIGGMLDRSDSNKKKADDLTNANMERMANIGFGKSIHGQNSSFMKMGGEVSSSVPDIAPLWGGGIKPLSHNPYTDGGGQTMMFSGDSHKQGGIGVNYAGNKIEAEGGEPAIKMQDGGQAENLVIYGDLPINEQTASMIGDPDSKGKKFKTYVSHIADKEQKANKRKERATMVAGEPLSEQYKFDRLKLDTQALIAKGSDAKLKSYAEIKENAAFAQNAINETAEEMGVDPVILAKGGKKLEDWMGKQQRKLVSIPGKKETAYAQNGNIFKSEDDARAAGFELVGDEWIREVVPGSKGGSLGIIGGTDGTQSVSRTPGKVVKSAPKLMSNDAWKAYLAKETPEQKERRLKNEVARGWREAPTEEISVIPGTPGEEVIIPDIDPVNEYAQIVPDNQVPLLEDDQNNRKGWNPVGAISAISSLFGRGTDAERLNGNQLWGEMYAMANNHLEPVYAQSFKPELDVPFDISLQDQLNRNTSTFRGAQRMSNGNPAAIAMMAAQQYGADQPVLAEQFRANQSKKDQVYSNNRATLNDAQLKNLGIFDQQFVRQEQAKSNTKEAHQLALNSISDKYMKNKLEQRTLQTYENMYNYRFGKDYVADNVNDAVNWEQRINGAIGRTGNTGGIPPGTYPTYDRDGSINGYRFIDNGQKKNGYPSTKGTDFNPDLYSKYGSMSAAKALKKY